MRRDKAKHGFAPTQDVGLCPQRQLVRYAFIEANQYIFSITTVCCVLSVKPSSLDKSQYQRPTEQVHRNHCELLVRAAYSETRERYGYERLHARLTEQGHYIRQYMVRSIKQEYGIKCRRYKRFKVTTESNHNKLVYPNRLDQTFNANSPNEAWVSVQ